MYKINKWQSHFSIFLAGILRFATSCYELKLEFEQLFHCGFGILVVQHGLGMFLPAFAVEVEFVVAVVADEI